MWYITNRKGDIRLDKEKCRERIMEQLEEVNDPELNIDIVNLGLVYRVDIDDDGRVQVTMTLTAMGCPLAGTIEQQVRDAVQKVDGVTDVQVDIVWNPPWDKSRMSRLAKIALGIHDG
jgi:FeS assembly SUF system protein